MSVLEIVRYPHPTLAKRCKEVEAVNDEVKTLVQDMIDTMYEANGIGLAACQVGVSQRIIVVDVSPMDSEQHLFVLLNPELLEEEGEVESEEGCLSVPDCVEKVSRKKKVRVKGLSVEGKEIEVSGEGILAIALQHEIDHLNGVLILDHISRLKREIYRDKVKKEKKKEKEKEKSD